MKSFIQLIKTLPHETVIKNLYDIYRKVKHKLHEIYNYCCFVSFKNRVNFTVLSDKETLDYIINKHVSIARYGDGEYGIMNNSGNGFQHPNTKLKNRLIEVLTSDYDNCLVCIPRPLVNHNGLNMPAKCFWNSYIKDHGGFILNVTPHKSFGNANCTRFYIDYKDNGHATTVINLFKKVWRGRDVCIIEGANSKLGCGNDLFDGAKSIKRIICPPTDAFQKYDEILSSVTQNVSKNYLLLLALGMTATILAYDLSKMGYQALDVGHIDIEYEWYLMQAASKVPIVGKAVNECNANYPKEQIEDSLYKDSIIDMIL